MAKINRRIMITLKVLVSLVMSVTAVYQLMESSKVENIVFWLLAVLFCVGHTVEYIRRDYEK